MTVNYCYCKNFYTSRTKDDAFSRTSKYVERAGNIGSEYGLSVLLDPQLDDYFYKILPINGFKVNGKNKKLRNNNYKLQINNF